MPYIDESSRKRLGMGGSPDTVGELTYLLYREAPTG